MTEREIRQQWGMAKITLQETESHRQTYREAWEEGIEVRGGVVRQLVWIRERDSRATTQPERSSSRK
jgi:hypothetical protein